MKLTDYSARDLVVIQSAIGSKIHELEEQIRLAKHYIPDSMHADITANDNEALTILKEHNDHIMQAINSLDNNMKHTDLELNKKYWLDPYTTGVYIGVNNGREETILHSSFGFKPVEYVREPAMRYEEVNGVVWFSSDTYGFKPYEP